MDLFDGWSVLGRVFPTAGRLFAIAVLVLAPAFAADVLMEHAQNATQRLQPLLDQVVRSVMESASEHRR